MIIYKNIGGQNLKTLKTIFILKILNLKFFKMLDLVKPAEHGKIRLKDLKQCKMANVFFDTFINLEKYLEYEQRDPFSNIRDIDNPDQSDWDKYAAEEYENLVSEDVNGDNADLYK